MSTAYKIKPEEVVFVKTELGRQEIARRGQGLATHLRTLLLLIDGRQSVSELLGSLVDMKYELHHFYELAKCGFISDTMNNLDLASLASRAGQLDETVEMTSNAEALLAADNEKFDWDAPLPGSEIETEEKLKKPKKVKKKVYPW